MFCNTLTVWLKCQFHSMFTYTSTSPMLEVTNEFPSTVSYTTLGRIFIFGSFERYATIDKEFKPPQLGSLQWGRWWRAGRNSRRDVGRGQRGRIFQHNHQLKQSETNRLQWRLPPFCAGNALYHIYKQWIFHCNVESMLARKQGGLCAPQWFQKGATADFQQEVVELQYQYNILAFHPPFLIPIYITLSRYHVCLSILLCYQHLIDPSRFLRCSLDPLSSISSRLWWALWASSR